MSDSEDGIPEVQVCQKLVEEFAAITDTDEACAQFYLQDRQWDLEKSVNAFFEAKSSSGIKVLHDGTEPEIVINFNKKHVEALEHLIGGKMTTEPPKILRFMTWNLDGLSSHNLKRRTRGVCEVIETEIPDVIFFQEVVPDTLQYLRNKLDAYHCYPANNEGYFTVTFLRHFTIYYDQHEIIPYVGTKMVRNLLAIEAHVGPMKLSLLNTHLESTKEHEMERKRQLKFVFDKIQTIDEARTIIFAGDMNLRDSELTEIGGLPRNVDDVWESCGARKECKYTWDATRNTNIELSSGRNKPRLRFDRVFSRPCSPVTAFVPVYFGLVGIQKVDGTQSFPSDHWGIVVHFSVDKRFEALYWPKKDTDLGAPSTQSCTSNSQ